MLIRASLYLSKDVICYVVQRAVTPGASSSLSASTLDEQQRIKQQLRLLEIFRNVDIFMHPEHLWLLADRKLLEQNKGITTQLEVVNITFILFTCIISSGFTLMNTM